MPTFPAYAKIELGSFGEKRDSAVLRTTMESGPPRQARINSRVMVTRSCTIWCDSKADYLAFVAWFKTTLQEGALWFDWTDPVSGTVKQARFVGEGLEAQTVNAAFGFWKMTLKIETWG